MLPISNNWIWVCRLDLSRPDGCQFGFGGGSRPLVFFRRCPGWMLPISNNWIWVCKLGAIGFGGGSRPLVFFSADQERAVSSCPSGAQNGQILPEFVLLCCRPRKVVFKRKRAVSGPLLLCCRPRNGRFLEAPEGP